MPFDRGSFTFTMFDVDGAIPEDLASCFLPAKAGSLDSVSAESQIGWVTGKHLLDTVIDESSIMRAGVCFLNLRQAVRKIPSSLLTALCMREEQAFLAANPGRDFVSGKEKKRIKEDVIDRHINKMPPSLSGIPVVFDPHSRLIYLGTAAQNGIDLFVDHFYRATKLEAMQLTPALILDRDFHTTVTAVPQLEITNWKSSENCIGRDFLTWLLYYCETSEKFSSDGSVFDLLIEDPLLLSGDSDDPGSGEAVIKKGGSPLRSAEVKAALGVGKKLRKAKISLTRDDNSIWSGTFDADNFSFSSFKLPESEEMDPDEVFADRIRDLEDFRNAWIGYFKLFADSMINDHAAVIENMKKWIRERDAI